MRKIFKAELQALGDDLTQMAELVNKAITGASHALLNGDLDTAQQVIVDDQQIDDLERSLDERCVLLLAQQQPVATDLRLVVTALRMSATLERMGDLARHIAQVARRAYPTTAVPAQCTPIFEGMAGAAQRVATRIHGLLDSHDLDMAQTIEEDDEILDNFHTDVFSTLLGGEWEGTPQQTIDVTLLSRYFERFGDHGVSVARRMTFVVTGDFHRAATNDAVS
ncbi:phosphate signaling complex protein PhoU [Jonesia denitrificans]|uniref:Phosphate-specific transport system accessory protein PhoU n=1 Tax=Jonesia denitrificans (strain ATCC 14870 / DSM 20603 / BCRC 15368 / CIP 55.134 / JCM 11481 / NBRC 15587 / NCTC 10816 / Prevot 55134) TaxID=471856 RepID=C7R0Z9_JONDD|nr:phosphate signaling complex protein PhoU [Jonesia denitrificans]ACV09723.1 phosphate uptake regulator, PhoU [Jonesia denitrificans DSM 20603]ASE09065.1 phosphate transport system regulatory protein PhoU [Jonesia denitrificans]QXB43611.1 phosphate signaling complex protein PhoU [Jonesia denitrificans]SQH22290.1 Phosphate transport system protein phoU [Jonesia denitrificans]